MIQLIGVMIGAYILTRMIETINNKETIGLVAVFAFITCLVVLVSIVGLFISGAHISSVLSEIPHSN